MTQPCPALLGKQVLTIARDVVCSAYGITTEQLLQRDRTRAAVEPRQVLWWLTRELAHVAIQQIADFCERDHTTVVVGIGTIKRKRAASAYLRQKSQQMLVDVRARATAEIGAEFLSVSAEAAA